MNKLIKLKQIQIEGKQETCSFNWRYVEKRNLAVLNKAIQRASMIKTPGKPGEYTLGKPKDLKYFIIELETEAGYLNQNTYGDIEPIHMIELSRKEITKERLDKYFT